MTVPSDQVVWTGLYPSWHPTMVGSGIDSTGVSETCVDGATVVVAVRELVTALVEVGASGAGSSAPHPDTRTMSVPTAATPSFSGDGARKGDI